MSLLMVQLFQVAMLSNYCINTLILSTAVLWCHAYPQLLDYDKTDCIYYFYRNEHRLDYPMALMHGTPRHFSYGEHFAPLKLCSTITPEGRTIGFLWPVGMKTLCSSDKALDHIWAQTKTMTNRSTTGRLFNAIKRNLSLSEHAYTEFLINGYVIVRINCTQKGKLYNVAYKLIESANVSVIAHTVDNGVVVKPDLALYYNFTDLEKSYKEHLRSDERIVVVLNRDKLYYVHENEVYETHRVYVREEKERSFHHYLSFCSYTNYMKYCAEKLDQVHRKDKGIPEKCGCKKCRPGFAGFHCHIEYTWTSSMNYENGINNCSSHSRCENTFGSYKCICHDGWQGIYCDEDIDECKEGQQLCGRMTDRCENVPGSYKCICKSGFTGVHCTNDIEECKDKPCRHGGLCIETYGSYICRCPQGWHGHNCEEDIDECTSNPCQNQAECANTEGGFKCKCPAYFTGKTCEIEIDACKSVKCVHGFCTGKGNNALCQCYGQWTGSKCNETVNMCNKEDTCMNGGACMIDSLMNFTCNCAAGFTGKNCEIDQNDCESNPCANGWCVDLVGGYKCICERGMEGDNCAKSENKCARLDCVGGTCRLQNGVPYCKCDEDHYGPHCEIEMDPCMSSPCRPDAHCINDLKNKGFICICPEDYEGFDCRKKKAYCTAASCFNDGTCLANDSPLGYECHCKRNTVGKRCEMLILPSGQATNAKPSTFSLILVIWAVGKALRIFLALIWRRHSHRSIFLIE